MPYIVIEELAEKYNVLPGTTVTVNATAADGYHISGWSNAAEVNSLTAAMLNVPIMMVTGDKMLCDWFHTVCPGTLTVPVNCGSGNGSVSIHPDKAVRLIRENAEKIAQLNREDCMFPLPEYFVVEINWRQHYAARRASFYPGCTQVDSKTARFESADWMDVLCFLSFCL